LAATHRTGPRPFGRPCGVAAIARLRERLAAQFIDRLRCRPAVREYFSLAIRRLKGRGLLRHWIYHPTAARLVDSQLADGRLGRGYTRGLASRIGPGSCRRDGLLQGHLP